jgi:hypothetical protein
MRWCDSMRLTLSSWGCGALVQVRQLFSWLQQVMPGSKVASNFLLVTSIGQNVLLPQHGTSSCWNGLSCHCVDPFWMTVPSDQPIPCRRTIERHLVAAPMMPNFDPRRWIVGWSSTLFIDWCGYFRQRNKLQGCRLTPPKPFQFVSVISFCIAIRHCTKAIYHPSIHPILRDSGMPCSAFSMAPDAPTNCAPSGFETSRLTLLCHTAGRYSL